MQLTQARIEEMRNTYVSVKCYEDWPLDRDENIELCNMALRLAAIENAGDEEVESLHESFYKLLPLNTLEARRCGAFDTACELLKERNQVVAELRAKLGERESLLRTLYDSPSIGEIANDDTYYRLEKFIAGSEVGGG